MNSDLYFYVVVYLVASLSSLLLDLVNSLLPGNGAFTEFGCTIFEILDNSQNYHFCNFFIRNIFILGMQAIDDNMPPSRLIETKCSFITQYVKICHVKYNIVGSLVSSKPFACCSRLSPGCSFTGMCGFPNTWT